MVYTVGSVCVFLAVTKLPHSVFMHFALLALSGVSSSIIVCSNVLFFFGGTEWDMSYCLSELLASTELLCSFAVKQRHKHQKGSSRILFLLVYKGDFPCIPSSQTFSYPIATDSFTWGRKMLKI